MRRRKSGGSTSSPARALTPATLQAIVAHCRRELVPGRLIQDEASILDAAAGHFSATHALMGELLDYLTRPPAS